MGEAQQDFPAVSVLMTAYNCSSYLPAAVESVLRQTFCELEIVLVNDGSTDDTGEIACSYDDPRICVINNPCNLGRTPSLNVALAHARGRYLACLDADDVAEPERLGRQVEFLERYPRCAAVGSAGRLIDASGNPAGTYAVPVDPIDIHWRLLFGNPMIHSSVLMRREVVVEQLGGYDTTYLYAQDYDMCSRIAFSHMVANLPEPLVSYRIHDQALSATQPALVEREPRSIRLRNLRRLLPAVSVSEAEMLRVMGWGVKSAPAGVSVTRALALYHRLRRAFLASLADGVATAGAREEWSRRQDARSVLALVDAFVQSGDRASALAALARIRRDRYAISRGSFLRHMAKALCGPRLTNLVRKHLKRERPAYGMNIA